MKVDVPAPSDKSKIPLPTLSQINADRITLVSTLLIRLYFHIPNFFITYKKIFL